jgi:hypothetical protein
MATSLIRLEAWFRNELPRLNCAALDEAQVGPLAGALKVLLPELPSPERLDPIEAQRLVIGLGLAGSSVARHYQEQDPGRKRMPEKAFDGLVAGPEGLPFRRYFAALAEQTGSDHYERDAYASLVIWNVPTTEVRFRGRQIAELRGATPDHILSYTGDAAERWFFALVKRGQTLEKGANVLLEPIADGDLDPTSADVLRQVRLATVLLTALRSLFLEFADARSGHGMQPQYFMDVFRQFAAHWVIDDIPPSGALDVDSLKRDFLLGTIDEHYVRHVRRIMPALLGPERADLDRRMTEPSLIERLLDRTGVSGAELAGMSAAEHAVLGQAFPALGTWYELLSAHARAAGAHLMLSKRFLFNPQRLRDEDGIGDHPLVSNRRGTTGMNESMLDRLTQMRRRHSLSGFRPVPRDDSTSTEAGVRDVEVTPALPDLVRGSGTENAVPGTPAGRERLVTVE